MTSIGIGPSGSRPSVTVVEASRLVPTRHQWLAAGVVAAVAACAAVFAAVSFGRHAVSAHQAVERPALTPAYSPDEVQAAKVKACTAWDSGARAIGAASRTAAAAPKDWNDPATQAAVTAEARVSLVQTAFIRSQVSAATPPELATGIERYNVLTIALQDAEVRHLGRTHDALIDEQSALIDKLDGACGTGR
jgi:hypothetical protein